MALVQSQRNATIIDTVIWLGVTIVTSVCGIRCGALVFSSFPHIRFLWEGKGSSKSDYYKARNNNKEPILHCIRELSIHVSISFYCILINSLGASLCIHSFIHNVRQALAYCGILLAYDNFQFNTFSTQWHSLGWLRTQ